MMFGDASSVGAWKDDPRIELHGPGYSKIVIGEDCADEWEKHIDVIARSVSENGGRSCVNASGVWVTRHGAEIAEALAEKLSAIVPRAEDDPGAVLAPFADPSVFFLMGGLFIGRAMSRHGLDRRLALAPVDETQPPHSGR
jgi:acyl-CoA reductase-like NAD-dependent aldehyde dehydrogenase